MLGKTNINGENIQGVSNKSVIVKFSFFGTSSDSIVKEIRNAIIDILATRHFLNFHLSESCKSQNNSQLP